MIRFNFEIFFLFLRNISRLSSFYCMILQDDYIRDLSRFKLNSSVSMEMSSFLSGFWKVCKLVLTLGVFYVCNL